MRFHGIGDDERYLAVECCTTPHTTNALSLAGKIGQIRLACFDAWSTSLGHPMGLYFRVAVASQYPAYGRGRSEYIFRHYEVLERFLPDENQVLALVAVPCSARGMAYEPSLLVPVYQCCRISGQPSEVQLRHKYKYSKRRCRHLDFSSISCPPPAFLELSPHCQMDIRNVSKDRPRRAANAGRWTYQLIGGIATLRFAMGEASGIVAWIGMLSVCIHTFSCCFSRLRETSLLAMKSRTAAVSWTMKARPSAQARLSTTSLYTETLMCGRRMPLGGLWAWALVGVWICSSGRKLNMPRVGWYRRGNPLSGILVRSYLFSSVIPEQNIHNVLCRVCLSCFSH